MGLLGDIGSAAGSALGAAISGGETLVDRLTNSANNQYRSFEQDGFIVPPINSADGNGLPSSKIPSPRNSARTKRHIIHFFVPEIGVVNMYVNPESINYNYKKVINQDRTKGGYVLQYWGEELPTLNIRGTTASSGIEGLNVLLEVYRAEQLVFDPIALTIASDSTVSGLGDLINGVGQGIGGVAGSLFGAATGGLLGANPLTQTLLPRNVPTLASLAFGVEIYYSGIVYRGYFANFNYSETVDKLGSFSYEMQFVVTQTRGYRVNTFPWQRSANQGPSNSVEGGVPLSYQYY